jgi:hypothetical protein
MEEFKTSYTVRQYLQKVNKTFKNEDNKSLTDILESFRLISEDYTDLSQSKKEFPYSDYKFNNCPPEERLIFAKEQLQFIETLLIDKIYEKSGNVVTWWEIYKLIYDGNYSLVDKKNRKVVYPTATNNRPIGDVAYSIWNGLQIIDLDIKDEELTSKLKDILFDELKKYNWFL